MSYPTPSSLLPRRGWRRDASLVLALAVLCAALPAWAGELYQWKDANGVTHYSDAPPPAGADYRNRTISNRGTAAVASEETEAAAGASTGTTQCATARASLALLQGEGPVGADADRDGKPDATFTSEQRAAQTGLAEAAIKLHCSAAAAPADGEAS